MAAIALLIFALLIIIVLLVIDLAKNSKTIDLMEQELNDAMREIKRLRGVLHHD